LSQLLHSCIDVAKLALSTRSACCNKTTPELPDLVLHSPSQFTAASTEAIFGKRAPDTARMRKEIAGMVLDETTKNLPPEPNLPKA